jgi:hypothetical protein
MWLSLATFGALLGVMALLRNFEVRGHGARWRRSNATDEEVDSLLKP